MAQDTRVGDRQPTSMRIKLKYADVETFIQKYAVNISRGGIFIATKTPKAVGTPLKFEFLLAAGTEGVSIIRGEGQVLWTREFDPTQPTKAHGMGVKFTRLDAESQAIVDRALAFRAAQSERAQEQAGERREEERPAVPVAAAPPPEVQPAAQPVGRAPDEVTRPLQVDAPPNGPGRTREDVTRPISVEQAEAEAERTKETLLPAPRVKMALERDPSREVRIRGGSRGAALAELEQIARDWGVSDEQIERVLKRRRPRMVEATAELERLLRKPARPPTPSKAEALAGLRELLQKRTPVLEIDRSPRSQAQTEGDSQPVKKAR